MGLMIFDNRDSFTFNLLECFRRIGIDDIQIMSEHDFSLDKLAQAERIILGPGPGLPEDHPILFDILDAIQPHQLVLGICLGHEAIALHYGGALRQLDRVFHGDVAEISLYSDADPIYDNMPATFKVGLYHSWIVDEEKFPDSIRVNSRSELQLIMGLKHKELPQFGFQFHPESYRTESGLVLLKNWYKQIQ